MAEFDLSDILANAAGRALGQPGREQIEYIDIDLIDPDPRNFYELSDLDQLVANIELVGLQQPIRVRNHPENPERWMIVSGHRRRAAIRQLVDEGKEQFRAVGCIIEQPAESEALQELRLIYANSGTRKMTPAEVSRQAERVEMLLYELKEQGMEFPGRMRDHVAEACKVSKSKLSRLKVIRDKLVPELYELFEAGKIAEDAAYQAARLDERAQRVFLGFARKNKTGSWYVGEVAQNVLRNSLDGCEVYHGACDHFDVRMKEYTRVGYLTCGDHRCCRDCYDLKSCSISCKRVNELKNQKIAQTEKNRAEQKARDAAERAKREQEKKTRTERKAALASQQWQNLGERRRALGIGLDRFYNDVIDCLIDTDEEEWILGLENGGSPDDYDDAPFDYYGDALDICDLADVLQCTTDYLLGRTATPQPPKAVLESAPVWHDAAAGDLPEDGESVIAAVQYDVPRGIWVTEDLRFHNGKFQAYGSDMSDDIRIFWQDKFNPDMVPDSGTNEESEENDD